MDKVRCDFVQGQVSLNKLIKEKKLKKGDIICISELHGSTLTVWYWTK